MPAHCLNHKFGDRWVSHPCKAVPSHITSAGLATGDVCVQMSAVDNDVDVQTDNVDELNENNQSTENIIVNNDHNDPSDDE